jgi:4-hydroxy-tetrahydrodipicolinate synthase
MKGVFAAVLTPMRDDLTIDRGAFAGHCRRLLDAGCHGLGIFGTTGEANSLSIAERVDAWSALVEDGIPADALLPGTGACALPDAVTLAREALELGAPGVLALPPFYYKGVSDEGLFAAYARTIEAVGDSRLRIVLYHIPQMSGISFSLPLIARLIEAFPQTIVGIKDSVGDFANMEAIQAAHPDFSVLAGADPLLLPLLQKGGAGCITATSNLVADALRIVYDGARSPARAAAVEAAQARIVAYRALSNSYVQIPTIKAMIGLKTGNAAWDRTRPPLLPISPADRAALAEKFAALPAGALA